MGGILEDKEDKKLKKKAKQMAEEERKKSYDTQERGMQSMIKTSHAGISNGSQRKKLLGE